MNKEIIHTASNGKKYSISIRKYTPRDCFRLMGVHEADINKLLSKEKDGSPIICKSKLYALAGNSTIQHSLSEIYKSKSIRRIKYVSNRTNHKKMFDDFE